MRIITVTTQTAEPLDALVWRVLGRSGDTVTGILADNKGLAALGPVLPAGTAVRLPLALPAADTLQIVKLWD